MGVRKIGLQPALFLDRDGVLNELIMNPKTGEYESPHEVEDLQIFTENVGVLRRLQSQFKLFLVSNQPSFAKAKTSLETIKAIHERLHKFFVSADILFTEYYYCYHHPAGVVPGFSGECECRKPKPYFVFCARDKYDLDLTRSWFVGDQDTDIQCGQNAGLKTVLIENPHSLPKRGKTHPTARAADLVEASSFILSQQNLGGFP